MFQAPKKVEPTKIPSPKPLADILDRSRPNTKIPIPRRRNSKGVDVDEGKVDLEKMTYNRKNFLSDNILSIFVLLMKIVC